MKARLEKYPEVFEREANMSSASRILSTDLGKFSSLNHKANIDGSLNIDVGDF